MTLYLREVLDPIATITNGFWLIYPSAITLTFGKDQIPEFYDGIQYRTWLENRIRDALSCPSMVRLNNFVERWSLRVRIEPDCDVCKDDKDRMEPDDDGSCRGCLRTASDYEPLGGWENEVTKKLVVEFYDNPQAKGEAVVTMEGNITYPNEKGVSMDGLRFGFGQTSGGGSQIHLFRMMQTYLKDTPNRLINKDYRVDRNYISQTMQRRFYMGGWIDEHSYSPKPELPSGRNYVELRYDKPPGFGYEPAWKTVIHSDSLLSLLG